MPEPDRTAEEVKDPIVGLPDSESFSGEGGVDEEEVAPPFDATVGDDLSNLRAVRIVDEVYPKVVDRRE